MVQVRFFNFLRIIYFSSLISPTLLLTHLACLWNLCCPISLVMNLKAQYRVFIHSYCHGAIIFWVGPLLVCYQYKVQSQKLPFQLFYENLFDMLVRPQWYTHYILVSNTEKTSHGTSHVECWFFNWQFIFVFLRLFVYFPSKFPFPYSHTCTFPFVLCTMS